MMKTEGQLSHTWNNVIVSNLYKLNNNVAMHIVLYIHIYVHVINYITGYTYLYMTE